MSGTNESEALAFARFYASIGLRVVPVWGIDDNGKCLCSAGTSCPSAGKHPIPHTGVHAAVCDLRAVEAWWHKHPKANIGIATSAAFSVLDVDAKNGGLATFDALVKQYGAQAFESPYRVRTGGGGWHIAFRSPDGTKSRNPLLPGIDYKAEGGMIVAPCSRHASGSLYAFDPPTKAIDLSKLGALPAALLAKPSAAATSQPGKIAEGRRNSTLTSFAGKLRDVGIGNAEIETALQGLNAALCTIPLPDAEVRRIAASIGKYPAAVQPSLSFIGADELVAAVPPRVEWLVPRFLALGFVTEIIGHPKSGKSTLVREMVAAMQRGHTFLGHPVQSCRVLMLSEERDGTLSHAVNLHAIATQDLRVLQRHRVLGSPSWPEIVQAAVVEAKRFGARLLIIDTLPYWSLGESDENSAADGMKAMEPLLRAASEGLAVLSLRHMRKSGGDTVSAARGASSITGAADIVCTLSAHSGGDTFRAIESTGRVMEAVFKLVVELTPSGYVAHGNGQQIAQQAQLALETLVMSLLPNDEVRALAEKDLLLLLAKSPKPIGRTKLGEILKGLVAVGSIRSNGRGTNNDPKRYWLP